MAPIRHTTATYKCLKSGPPEWCSLALYFIKLRDIFTAKYLESFYHKCLFLACGFVWLILFIVRPPYTNCKTLSNIKSVTLVVCDFAWCRPTFPARPKTIMMREKKKMLNLFIWTLYLSNSVKSPSWQKHGNLIKCFNVIINPFIWISIIVWKGFLLDKWKHQMAFTIFFEFEAGWTRNWKERGLI